MKEGLEELENFEVWDVYCVIEFFGYDKDLWFFNNMFVCIRFI